MTKDCSECKHFDVFHTSRACHDCKPWKSSTDQMSRANGKRGREMSRRVHELKILHDYAESVYLGDKNFEIRFNDRGFQKGDIVRFFPMGKDNYSSIDTRHPLYRKEYEITYVVGSFRGLADGYVAFGIKPIKEGGDAE